MAFELEKFLTDIANSKSLNSVFNNPIYTALIIVSMVLLIIYFTMKNDVVIDEDSNTSMTTLMFTSGIYCILAVLGVVYLQHRSVTHDFETKYNHRAGDEVIDAAIDGAGEVSTLDVFNPRPALNDNYESVHAEESEGSEGSHHNTSASSISSSQRNRKKHHKKHSEDLMEF